MSRPIALLRSLALVTVFFTSFALASSRGNDFQGSSQQLEYEREPLKYSECNPSNSVSSLQRALAGGTVSLKFDKRFGYLSALLEALKIPRSSQMLVFSKTSSQRTAISPGNPRAIFFNDSAYVGFVPGAAALEVAVADPKNGGIFYRLENQPSAQPQLVRDADCLNCHGGQRSLGVPGFFVRSVSTDATGELDGQSEVNGIDQCTPLADRWAGWFVTGRHDAQPHRGNLVGTEFSKTNRVGNLAELSALLDVKKYPLPTSDITALMVLEHQTKMHNYITRLNFETQLMTRMYGHIRYLTSQEDAFLRYLLFTEEAPLAEPIAGNEDYARWFTGQGPFDTRGRSLRDFDLKTRLFKYPCSFLIYSEDFDALPAVMRDHLLQRLHAILTGKDKDPQFARLTAADRQAILEILRATKLSLPAYWRE